MLNEMMAREIAAQADILPRCTEPLAEAVSRIPRPAGRIFAGGCGDSAFAPHALTGVFAALGLDVMPRTAMEIASFTSLREGDTVILSSISGGTARTVEAADAASKAGARVIALTCNSGSRLDLAAHETVLLPFQPLSRKTPHTLDYAVTLMALAQLGLHWRGVSPMAILPLVEDLPQTIASAKSLADEISPKIGMDNKLIILGAGPDLGTAQYGAAKFHEAGGLVAIAAETENFIHGMNFLLEPEDVLLAVASNEAGWRRGSEIVAGFCDFLACATTLGSIPEEGWQSRWHVLLGNTILMQQLCLAVAERHGLCVEEPKAGRHYGDKHHDIQSALMKSVPVVGDNRWSPR